MDELIQRLATAIARDAHEKNLSSRRGCFVVSELGETALELLALYSNDPWPGAAHEARELAEWLHAEGITVVATGGFGEAVSGQPYTRSWLVSDPDREQEIVAEWKAILERLRHSNHPHIQIVRAPIKKGGA